MSSKVTGTTITLTRGDTLSLKVNILKDGEPYTPQEGDKIRFALKRNKVRADKKGYMDSEPLIEKEIPVDTMEFTINPEDTKPLPFGAYVYDVEIRFFSDNAVDTFIDKAVFNLTEEVH